ncbi:Pr6Pr family membrane protein [Microlunatus capsulatus]|uniref:Energy-coupling factor transporter transmembrane protein EcfT n=1 Tax=Microlunatus capsulatus TaxID=99117 RepID=A0ABS4Z826_9ACTN|nr:Pr6Pr family membrane protein [Microlunatus capsulatus]MBP2416862.1 energy-coupling factor transporter transmembrane protein EcfT [Microlunatus capsulatus]
MTRLRAVVLVRLVAAALSLAGVVVQLLVALETGLGAVSFFSYFTTLSNVLGSVVLIGSALRLVAGRAPSPPAVAVRGASVVYLAFVGLVFNTLLRGEDLGDLRPWVNLVHHVVMPLVVVVDWVLQPSRVRISLRTALLWAVFPAVYVAYSLVRGSATGFYPYPFFNPGANGGYGGVVVSCLVLLMAFAALALLVRWAGNRSPRQTGSTGRTA